VHDALAGRGGAGALVVESAVFGDGVDLKLEKFNG
jgi:hypothetical protein